MSLHRAGTSPEGGGHNWGGVGRVDRPLSSLSGALGVLPAPGLTCPTGARVLPRVGRGGGGARRTKGIGSGCGEGTGPGLRAQGPRGLPKAARGVSAVDLGEATGQVSRRVRPAGAARAVLRTEGRTSHLADDPGHWSLTLAPQTPLDPCLDLAGATPAGRAREKNSQWGPG